jgi:hypothetical protein
VGAAIETDGIRRIAAGARRIGDAQQGAGRFVGGQLVDAARRAAATRKARDEFCMAAMMRASC